MIRYVRVDYAAPHRPGIPVIVCDANGKIVFERDGMEPTKRDRRRARTSASERKYNKVYSLSIPEKGDGVNAKS